jgi:hypothetical protein
MRREYEALSKLVGRNFAVLNDGISVYLTPEGEIRDVDGKILMAADAGRAKLFEKNLKSGEGGGVSREEFDKLSEEMAILSSGLQGDFKDKYIKLIYPECETLLSYFIKKCALFVLGTNEVREELKMGDGEQVVEEAYPLQEQEVAAVTNVKEISAEETVAEPIEELAAEPVVEPVEPKEESSAEQPKKRVVRRRKKSDEEDKELFPFYEQSLF